MANYTCATRTNYFRVNDAENFKAFMARAYGTEDRVDLWEEKDKDGNWKVICWILPLYPGMRS